MAKKVKASREGEVNKFAWREFWGLAPETPIDDTVYVWTDYSQWFKPGAGRRILDLEEERRQYEENELKPSTLQGLGLSRAMERDQRLTDLANGIANGSIKTVEDAVLKLDGIRTPSTVITYLKEMGKMLKYEETGQMVGSKTPIVKAGTVTDSRYTEQHYKYFDKDPKNGGKEITREEYDKLKVEMLEKLQTSLGFSKSEDA